MTQEVTGVTNLFAETVLLRQLEACESNTSATVTNKSIPDTGYIFTGIGSFPLGKFRGKTTFLRQTDSMIDSIFLCVFCKT